MQALQEPALGVGVAADERTGAVFNQAEGLVVAQFARKVEIGLTAAENGAAGAGAEANGGDQGTVHVGSVLGGEGGLEVRQVEMLLDAGNELVDRDGLLERDDAAETGVFVTLNGLGERGNDLARGFVCAAARDTVGQPVVDTALGRVNGGMRAVDRDAVLDQSHKGLLL